MKTFCRPTYRCSPTSYTLTTTACYVINQSIRRPKLTLLAKSRCCSESPCPSSKGSPKRLVEHLDWLARLHKPALWKKQRMAHINRHVVYHHQNKNYFVIYMKHELMFLLLVMPGYTEKNQIGRHIYYTATFFAQNCSCRPLRQVSMRCGISTQHRNL